MGFLISPAKSIPIVPLYSNSNIQVQVYIGNFYLDMFPTIT